MYVVKVKVLVAQSCLTLWGQNNLPGDTLVGRLHLFSQSGPLLPSTAKERQTMVFS